MGVLGQDEDGEFLRIIGEKMAALTDSVATGGRVGRPQVSEVTLQ